MTQPTPTPAESAPATLPGVATTTPTWRPVMLLPSLVIGAILSGLMTWLTVGISADFAWRWLTGFVGALPVMALATVLMTFYGRLVERHMPAASGTLRKLVLASAMALTLELLMSSVVTLRNVGWAEGFATAWATAFWRSLPVGLTIGLLMGFVVRPRMQRMLARA